MKKLSKLFEKKEKIAQQIKTRIEYLYPIGTVIRFEKGRAQVKAEVTRHGRGEVIFVRNIITLNEYRVEVWSGALPEIIEVPL